MKSLFAIIMCIILGIGMLVENCASAPASALQSLRNSRPGNLRDKAYQLRRADYLNSLVPYANYPGDLAR